MATLADQTNEKKNTNENKLKMKGKCEKMSI